MNKDEQGRVKCVACFLCATACPAHCIDIVAEPSPWPDREKYPKVFNIDELRCIYCGMCEQACPVEAIELTSFYDLTGASREEMIFDKEKLLSVFDQTKDREPMPSKRAGDAVKTGWKPSCMRNGYPREACHDFAASDSRLGDRVGGRGHLVALAGQQYPAADAGRRAGPGGVRPVSARRCPPWATGSPRACSTPSPPATIVAAVATISFRSPVYCAIWFGMTLTGTAGLFLLAGAEFLAVATLVVYAGAILVTFLFVLMLSQPEGHTSYDRRSWEAMISAFTGAVLVGILTTMIGSAITKAEADSTAARRLEDASETSQRQIPISEAESRTSRRLFGRLRLASERTRAAHDLATGRRAFHPLPGRRRSGGGLAVCGPRGRGGDRDPRPRGHETRPVITPGRRPPMPPELAALTELLGRRGRALRRRADRLSRAGGT